MSGGLGQIVGNYRLVRQLGTGGMGAVYEAVDLMLERPVAIKMLRAEIARQPDLIERFRVEAVTLARLNHPSIATLYSFFREREEYYMVMEFVRGRTLEAMLAESRRLAPQTAAEILRQTLEAMAHAHKLGVLHRDIKPANVMITNEGAVKVTDFGIARILGTSRMTREGRLVGTLEYIAPERIRGEEADIRSDVYSAGVVLYEALSGRLPFVSDTDYGLIQAHLTQAPPLLRELGFVGSPELESVVRKAMAKRAEDRFQSAEEFRDVLAGFVEPWRPVAAPATATQMRPTRLAAPPPAPVPVPAPTRLAVQPSFPGPAFAPTPTPPQPAARKLPLAWFGVAAIVLVLMAAGSAWLLHLREKAEAEKAAQQAAAAVAQQPAPVAQAPAPAVPPVAPLTQGLPPMNLPPATIAQAPAAAASGGGLPPALAIGSSPAPPAPARQQPAQPLASPAPAVHQQQQPQQQQRPPQQPADAGGLGAAVGTPAAVAPAPTSDTAAAPAPVKTGPPRSIRGVRRLFIEPMSHDLADYLAEEIRKQLPHRVILVSSRESAQAVMSGSGQKHSGSRFTAGFRDEFTASVTITTVDGGKELWSSEAGDRMMVVGPVKHGGPRRAAERLINNLKKVMEE